MKMSSAYCLAVVISCCAYAQQASSTNPSEEAGFYAALDRFMTSEAERSDSSGVARLERFDYLGKINCTRQDEFRALCTPSSADSLVKEIVVDRKPSRNAQGSTIVFKAQFLLAKASTESGSPGLKAFFPAWGVERVVPPEHVFEPDNAFVLASRDQRGKAHLTFNRSAAADGKGSNSLTAVVTRD